jgi:hypothetical protein
MKKIKLADNLPLLLKNFKKNTLADLDEGLLDCSPISGERSSALEDLL